MGKQETMVERVARAIFETWAADGNSDATWEELLLMQTKDGYAEGKKIYALALKEARAAIEAMRTPTDAMVSCGEEASGMQAWDHIQERLRDAYSAMLTAALNEDSGE